MSIYICGRIMMCREAGRLDFALIHQQASDRRWAIGDRLGAIILEGAGEGLRLIRRPACTSPAPCPPAPPPQVGVLGKSRRCSDLVVSAESSSSDVSVVRVFASLFEKVLGDQVRDVAFQRHLNCGGLIDG